jgi:hypothetical protein
MAKKSTKSTKTSTKKTQTKKDSTLYYFYSVGCGWCKKCEPIVDELNTEGYDILKLDLADSNNQGLKKELEEKYKTSCGTPWMIDGDTGNAICGYREKDIVQKWADGEEIPAPPRPKGMPPRPPFQDAAKDEIKTWKKDYEKWLKENDHLPDNQKKTADEILDMPRPKSQPPMPPQKDSTDEQLTAWKETYGKWVEENNHLPNLQTPEQVVERLKKQWNMAPPTGVPTATGQAGLAEFNKNINTEYHYVVEGNQKIEVQATQEYILGLKQQYYVRESNGLLTKVVGDAGYEERVRQRNINTPTAPASQGPSAGPPTQEKTKEEA